MIIGGYGIYGDREMPCILHISVARYDKELPVEGESLMFLVSIHVEGTAITWQQNVSLDYKTECEMISKIHELYCWSLDKGFTKVVVQEIIRGIGASLFDLFIGEQGKRFISSLKPTAILLDVDETIQNLPWELLGEDGKALSMQYPLGRLVTTRFIPQPARDPLKENRVVKILAVIADPSKDLVYGKWELNALKRLELENWGDFSIEIDTLEGAEANKDNLLKTIEDGSFDIIHFSSHGLFDEDAPEESAIVLSDGRLTADDILGIKWNAPPYLVVGSVCESARSVGGKRIVSNNRHSNGIAAAFIAKGVSSYIGYYWPVNAESAAKFFGVFYPEIFQLENVGLAFLSARNALKEAFDEFADLTCYNAVFYGDSGSGNRKNIVTAEKGDRLDSYKV